MDTKQAMRLLLAGAAGFVASALFAPALAATYKWTDDQGEVHYSDKAPPDVPSKGATVLDKQARAVKKIEPPLSPEETKAKAEQVERERALAKTRDEQARKDRALMQSYTSENEIDLARNRALATIDTQIKSAQTYSADLARRQKDLGKRKEGYAGKPIPIELERESTSVDEELSRQMVLLRQKQEEMTMVTAKYDTIKQRWREILADQERTAAAAAAAEAAKAQNPPPAKAAATPRPAATTANK